VAAAQHGSRLLEVGRDLAVTRRQVAVGGQVLTLRTPAAIYEDIFLPLLGEHQAVNAMLALAAVEAFFGGAALPAEAVEEGFASVTSPGRLELVRSSPTVLVDAAHNPHGIGALRDAVAESFAFRRLVGVVSCMADKEAEAMLGELEPLLDEVVVTGMRSARAMDPAALYEIAQDVFMDTDRVHLRPSLADALDLAAARAEAHGDPAGMAGVLVVGSVLLAAEARQLMGRTDA